MKKSIIFIVLIQLFSCTKKESGIKEKAVVDLLAKKYVSLGLAIGQYDTDFVDAYYGSDSLKPSPIKQPDFPKDSLLKQVENLLNDAKKIAAETQNDTIRARTVWLSRQLTSFGRRIRIFSGDFSDFDVESKELFDAVAPVYAEQHFKSLIAQLDAILPGKGALADRYQKFSQHFLLPKNKIDTVFKVAIAEARRRTLQHYKLPHEETFQLEYVTNKPWSGYNWYQGKFKSVIQINTSQPIFIERAIDLACHEGYPGHHVFNALLEKNLYVDKGYTEISMYPLFSPQSLIAEGSANYGISVAFPGKEQQVFCTDVLMPLAGIDTTGTSAYFMALEIKSELNYARNEVARALGSGKMTDKEALHWLTDYCLLTPEGAKIYLKFIHKYRSYVINYNYGQDLVKNYIEKQSAGENSAEKRWKAFEKLLSNELTASDLLK